MSARTRDVDKGYKRVVRDLNLRGATVKVGIVGPKAAAEKKVPKDAKPTSASIAEIAGYLHEGTEHAKPRPFIVVWFDENVAENRRFAKHLAAQRIAGKLNLEKSLRLMGVRAVGGIQKRIADGPFAPNAESTLARKAPKTKPLINTGQLRSSVAFEILGGPS